MCCNGRRVEQLLKRIGLFPAVIARKGLHHSTQVCDSFIYCFYTLRRFTPLIICLNGCTLLFTCFLPADARYQNGEPSDSMKARAFVLRRPERPPEARFGRRRVLAYEAASRGAGKTNAVGFPTQVFFC